LWFKDKTVFCELPTTWNAVREQDKHTKTLAVTWTFPFYLSIASRERHYKQMKPVTKMANLCIKSQMEMHE